MKTIVCFIISFLLILKIRFVFLPGLVAEFVYDMFSLGYLVANYGYTMHLWNSNNANRKKDLMLCMAIYMFSILWGLIVVAARNGESSFIFYLILGLCNIINYICIAVMLIKNFKEKSLEMFILFYLLAMTIYVLSTVYMLIDPSFKEFWFGVIEENPFLERGFEEHYITRVGLLGFSSVNISFIMQYAIILALFYIDMKPKSFLYFIIIVLLMGDFFYARWGILASLSIFLMYSISHIKYENFFKYIFIIGIFALFMVCLFDFLNDNIMVSLWLAWIMDPVYSFLNGLNSGYITYGSSTETLGTMYFLPDISTLMIGDGFFKTETGGAYMSTDPGVMRNMLFFGITGEVMIYSSFIVLLYWFYKKLIKKYRYSLLYTLMFGVVLLEAELKFNIINQAFSLICATALLCNDIKDDNYRISSE